MKTINIMALFCLEFMILNDISNDIYKLGITLFLIVLSLYQFNLKQMTILIFTFLGDYYLAYQQDALFGIYFFILMQCLYLKKQYPVYILFILLIPIPLVYRLAFIYISLLSLNIKEYADLRNGFMLLLISDLFVGLFYLTDDISCVYLTWSLYGPAIFLLHKNLWNRNKTFLPKQFLEHNS